MKKVASLFAKKKTTVNKKSHSNFEDIDETRAQAYMRSTDKCSPKSVRLSQAVSVRSASPNRESFESARSSGGKKTKSSRTKSKK